MKRSGIHRIKGRAFAAVAAVIIAAVFSVDAAALRTIKKVRSLEFQGLKYLTRYEIIASVEARAENDGIVIDVDGLRDFLRSSAYVKSFTLKEERDRIVITVIENEPAFVLALKKNGTILTVEMDDNLLLIPSKEMHGFDRPVIIVPQEEMGVGGLSRRIKNMLSLLAEAKKSGLPLYREIDEIDMSNGPMASIRLRGRGTRFTVEMDRDHLYALNSIAGYLDAARRYPDQVVYCGKAAVMK